MLSVRTIFYDIDTSADDVIEIHDRQYASVNDYYAGIGPHVYSEVDNKISKKEHHCEV